jgi:8-oxo-dGTP pyrophosphatase MutT (NUDIX family)
VRRLLVRAIGPKYSAGAICVVERSDGRILLIRQIYRNEWGLPGGLLQRKEEPVDAVQREVLEETGLPIELDELPATVLDPIKQRIDLVFRARPAPGTDAWAARPESPEIERLDWFAVDDLPELQEEAAGAMEALRRLDSR